MVKQLSSLVSKDARLWASGDQNEVPRYISAKGNNGSAIPQRRRLSDKLDRLVDDAERFGDASIATHLLSVLEGTRRRSRDQIERERRAPEAPQRTPGQP